MADRIQTQIDIAIKGGAELRRVNKQLNLLSNEIGQVLNRSGKFVKSFTDLNNQVRQANTLLNNAASGTLGYRKSIEAVVKTESALNAELSKRNLLLKGGRSAQGMGLAVDPVLKSIERNRKKEGPLRSIRTGRQMPSKDEGFLAFSIKVTEAEKNLAIARSQSLEKTKSLLSIERKRAKTESFAANFKRFRRGRSKKDREIRGQVLQSAGIGGGFPLLFGGGPLQAAAGALGGGIGGLFGKGGGFAGSIVATALVSQVQQTVTAIADLGKAMGPFTQDTSALVNAMGLAGTAEAARLQIIEQLEGKQAAFNAAMQKMNETVGTEATKRLKDFGEKASLVGSEFKIAMTRMQASLIPVINLVDRLFGISANAQRLQRERTIKNSKDVNIRSRVDEIGQLRSQTGGGRQEVKRRNDRIKLLERELKLRADVEIIETNIQTKADELTLEFTQHVKKIQEKADLEKEVAKLMAGGMKQSVAEQIAQNNILADQARKRLEVELLILKAKIADPDTEGEALNNAIVSYNAIKKALQDIGVEQDKINKLTEEFGKKTEKVKVTKEQITNLLANEMTSAVMGLIEGTKTLGEALASVAKSLASMFLNAAFQNIFSGLFSGGGKTPAPIPGVLTAQGGFYRTGGFKAFQYGGVVNSPTLGMIGEGGEPEYVIPASKMSGAMARYSAGARGGAVIPGGSHEAGTVAGGSGSTVVQYTGPVLNFNGDDYVPKDSVPQIISAAARQGATMGQSKMMSTLKNSRSQRSKIGI